MTTKILTLFIVSLFVSAAWAQSPKEPLNHPKSTHDTSKPEERGTEQSPFIIKAIPTPKTEAETAAEVHDKQEKTANDRQLVYWTRALVGVGVVQFLVLVVQAFVFGNQARRLRETVEATKDIGRKAIAAELPIVFAKEITLRQLYGPKYPQELDPVGVLKTILERHSEVTVRFVNYGRTPAPINSACIRHLVASGLPITPVFEPISFVAGGGPVIKSGQESTLTFAEYVLHLNADEMNRINSGQHYLWVYGLITFQDFWGDNHDCGFCYQWSVADPTGFVFAPATPREYNRRT